MAPAEGRADAATHDGGTIAGSGAVGAVLGDADVSTSVDVSDLAARTRTTRLAFEGLRRRTSDAPCRAR